MTSRSSCVNAFLHPWVPAKPVPLPLGYLVAGDRFVIPGIAEVRAFSHRRRHEARAFAKRIAAEQVAYLDVRTAFDVPGIVDRRPASHARGGTPVPKLASRREVAIA